MKGSMSAAARLCSEFGFNVKHLAAATKQSTSYVSLQLSGQRPITSELCLTLKGSLTPSQLKTILGYVDATS